MSDDEAAGTAEERTVDGATSDDLHDTHDDRSPALRADAWGDDWGDDAIERLGALGFPRARLAYGGGEPKHWATVHARFDDGDELDAVVATSSRWWLRPLGRLTYLRLRTGDLDWPDLTLPGLGLRARIGVPEWTVSGRVRGVHVDLTVTLPEGVTATDGADVRLTLRSQSDRDRTWSTSGSARSGVGPDATTD